jgi:glutaredoxin
MILYIKSKCSLCQVVKDYLDAMNIQYEIINIDNRIPADLIEAMQRQSFPDKFNYPILIIGIDQLLFGKDILNFK